MGIVLFVSALALAGALVVKTELWGDPVAGYPSLMCVIRAPPPEQGTSLLTNIEILIASFPTRQVYKIGDRGYLSIVLLARVYAS